MPSTRNFTPRRLGARSALILFVPILVILLGMTWYYYDFHIRQVDRTLTSHVGRTISLYLEGYERGDIDYMANAEGLQRVHEITVTKVAECARANYDHSEANAYNIRRNLGPFLEKPFLYQIEPGDGLVRICVTVDGRDDVRFDVLRKRMVVINSHIFIVWVVLSGLLMALIAYGFLRNQIRSVLRLSEAAKAFGRGREMPGYKPSGASEIRDAARAVIDMKSRLTAFAEQRTTMLAGVSHDLRTPLTRLKLELAMMPPGAEREAIDKDIKDMEAMLDEYLAFARGEDTEPPSAIEVDRVVADLSETIRDGRLALENISPVQVIGRRLAIKRAIGNLIQNALDHSENVRVSFSNGPRWLDILVDDDGPGIMKEQRAEALKPFSRLDPARSQNKAGAGLGLALAHDTASAHGGELRLETSPLGGLRARLRLPH